MIRQASVLEKLDKNHSKFGYRNKNKLIAQGSVLTAGGGFNPISKNSQSTNERISRFDNKPAIYQHLNGSIQRINGSQ